MANFTDQLRNLTLKNKIPKPTFGLDINSEPPFFDPSNNHICIWKHASCLPNLKYEQKTSERFVSNKIPVNPKRMYCCVCHMLKKKPFIVKLGYGEMCQDIFTKPLYPETIKTYEKSYESYSIYDKKDKLMKDLEEAEPKDRDNFVFAIKELDKSINWIEKNSNPDLYRISYLQHTINMDYISAGTESIQNNDYQGAFTYLWISYTLTRDPFILNQIQSLLNGYHCVYGYAMYDHVKEHNQRIKSVVEEINFEPSELKKDNPYIFYKKPQHFWEKDNEKMLKRKRYHGLHPFPRMSKPYVIVKSI